MAARNEKLLMARDAAKLKIEKLVNPKETAGQLGVQAQTLAIWRMTGRNLPYVKVGRSVKYKQSDITAYIERQTVPATA